MHTYGRRRDRQVAAATLLPSRTVVVITLVARKYPIAGLSAGAVRA
jgi:ABC-type glycerol-3-phosphate transport system permease component